MCGSHTHPDANWIADPGTNYMAKCSSGLLKFQKSTLARVRDGRAVEFEVCDNADCCETLGMFVGSVFPEIWVSTRAIIVARRRGAEKEERIFPIRKDPFRPFGDSTPTGCAGSRNDEV